MVGCHQIVAWWLTLKILLTRPKRACMVGSEAHKVTVIRRFEGNAADDNRRKERSQLKRHTRQILTEDEEDETPEEREFREEQERLTEDAKALQNETEDLFYGIEVYEEPDLDPSLQ